MVCLLLFVVIALIVGVCSILWGKPLQNLAYQWPFCERLRKEGRLVGFDQD